MKGCPRNQPSENIYCGLPDCPVHGYISSKYFYQDKLLVTTDITAEIQKYLKKFKKKSEEVEAEETGPGRRARFLFDEDA